MYQVNITGGLSLQIVFLAFVSSRFCHIENLEVYLLECVFVRA